VAGGRETESTGPVSLLEVGTRGEVTKHGIPAAHGIAIGRAYLVDRRRLKTPKRRLEPDEIDDEIARFHRAVDLSDRQLDRVKQKIELEEGESYNIIAAHQLILRDEHVVDEAVRYIRDQGINAEWALLKTVEHIKEVFDAIADDYFRERRSDVDFVGERVLRNLLGRETSPVRPPPDAIVVAHDLSPADTAGLYRAAVAGLVTDAGGKTSHTAIVARAHEIPAVVGLEEVTHEVGTGDLVIVDGSEGLVIVNPSAQTVALYRDRARKEVAAGAALLGNRDLPATTTDGVHIDLVANVDAADEVSYALEHGAEGVGLFRTEYLFLTRAPRVPSEAEHFKSAMVVLNALDGKPATFRTFDLGADKLGSLIHDYHEPNPALGLRSMRLCLTDRVRPLFKAQLRGLLRASANGKLRIMFPMISGLRELHQAKEVLAEAKAELAAEGVDFDGDVPVGIMIEMPSAAVLADVLAREVDFFSVGTNDLIQYTLAVDRVNEHVTYLYEPLHPALLRLIRTVVEAGDAAGISVAVCGEMAGVPHVVPVLLGLGVHELSMNAVAIPEVKNLVRRSRQSEMANLAQATLSMATAKDVTDAVAEFLEKHS